MTKFSWMVSASAMLGLIAASAVQGQVSSCVGDCKDNMTVDVVDLVIGVNIALGEQQLSACPAFDCMHDGTVTVTCLVQGVNNALLGCGFVTATPTVTPMGGAATPTPTATPTTASVVRVFTIDPGKGDFATPEQTGTGLFSSGLTGGNAAAHVSSGPITLLMGAQDANGVAPLSLQSSVTLSIDVDLNGSCLCLQLLTDGQHGEISCNGGVPYDTQAERMVNMAGNSWTATSGLGNPGGAGDAELLVMANFEDVAMKTCAQADCEHHVYSDPPNLFAFTTTTATGLQDTTGAPIKQHNMGKAFDCANFMTAGVGELVAPAPANIVIPTANVFRFSETASPQ